MTTINNLTKHDLTYASHTAGAKDELSGNSEEFKLDDLIVFRNGDNTEILKVQYVWDDAVWGGYCGEIYKNNEVRHATPEEINAGHRLEAERHG